mmetsp:Transcript_20755/g.71701  ORF Transcript_20755/g.71701 Transcript_20755/m.71701 type:complete len:261 (-) Transcript_20755:250-1032(-)
MRRRSNCNCISLRRSSSVAHSLTELELPLLGVFVTCSSSSGSSKGCSGTSKASSDFGFTGLATPSAFAGTARRSASTTQVNNRSLCLSEAASTRHGARASSTALDFSCWDCLHAWRWSRHLNTACSKCFNFLRRTKVPTSLRKPRPLSSKLACQYRSKRGLTCESSRLQDRTVDPQETALTGGIPSGTPFSSTIWHNDWYKEGQHPSNPGLGAKATASSIPTTGLSVSCLSTMRSTSHNNVVAAASAEECPNACTSKRTL